MELNDSPKLHRNIRILSEIDRTRIVTLYTIAIIFLGLFSIGAAFTHLPENLPGLLEFVLLAALSELFSVELFVTSRNSRISVSSVVAIAGMITFGVWAGVITFMVAAIVISVMTQFSDKKSPTPFIQRATFNIGMLTTSIAGAGGVYIAAGGRVGNFSRLEDLIPLALCVVTNELLNTVILLGVLVVQIGKNPLELWRDDFQWSLPIDILGGIIGGSALAWVYGSFHIIGLVVFFFPILALSYSYRIYVDRMRGYVTRLEELNRDLDENNIDLFNTLSAVIDASDIYTNGHSKQVAIYAGDIAEKLQLSQKEQELLVVAALLHDIGKVGISDRILGKDDRLTEEEYSRVKLHTIIGADIVGQMKGMKILVPLIKYHHEYWDGNGYPDGLQGEAIPLGARILSLADSLDTICSDRPWRPTRSFEEVIIEIQRCSGQQFDPQVVRALLELVEEKGKAYLKNSAAIVDESNRISGAEKMGNKLRYLKRSMVFDIDENRGK